MTTESEHIVNNTDKGVEQANTAESDSNNSENDNHASESHFVKQKLNWLNFFNLIGYLLNVGITFGLGMGDEENDIGTTSDSYQTIVSPSGWAFSIWSIIFIAQGIFAIVQLLPRFRASELVQRGVRYYYGFACIFQCAWTPVFNSRQILASMIIIYAIWFSLLAITVSQYYIESTSCPYKEFWLLRFPFRIHNAWITAASLLNTNIFIVDMGANVEIQLAAGIISLAILHAISVYNLFGINKPDYVFPAVFAWATGAIAAELTQPMESVSDRFDETVIGGVEYAAAAVSIIILSQIVVSILIQTVRKFMTSKDSTTESDNTSIELVTGLPAGTCDVECPK